MHAESYRDCVSQEYWERGVEPFCTKHEIFIHNEVCKTCKEYGKEKECKFLDERVK